MRVKRWANTFYGVMQVGSDAWDFYRKSMEILQMAGIPFLVGGAYAMRAHAKVYRETKDFDVMLQHNDVERALNVFRSAGYRANVLFPHWIAKVYEGDFFIDLIYNSGNGLCPVDEEWFKNAHSAEVLGKEVMLCPPEEIIWQKAYVMERERFDGADIAHLVKSSSGKLNWLRLISRFGEDTRVLLAHLLLVQFIYPSEPNLVPEWVIDHLTKMPHAHAASLPICNGTLLSRAQYLLDIEQCNYLDARIHSRRSMTQEEIFLWTKAIDE